MEVIKFTNKHHILIWYHPVTGKYWLSTIDTNSIEGIKILYQDSAITSTILGKMFLQQQRLLNY